MKLLVNENIPKASVHDLRRRGHDVVSVAEVAPAISDRQVLKMAETEGRIIITFDSDYGELVYF
ncbi:MAG: DUF5615 family PIN-like protein [bacterium]|nr:DUF5615 family PIN-like protein [bacterium]